MCNIGGGALLKRTWGRWDSPFNHDVLNGVRLQKNGLTIPQEINEK